jgi:predicted ATPase/class 3 adenylate cyclase
MLNLPSGTVTFLFSDIEGSTYLLQQLGLDDYAQVLNVHRNLLRVAWNTYNGCEISTEGDSFFVVFARAMDAVLAALQAQQALLHYPWPDGFDVRIRIGLHTGTPLLVASNYVGIDVHRAARIAAVGHGGQTLLSSATYALISHTLPENLTVKDLGEYRLKDLQRTEHLYQLLHQDLPAMFPPLKTLDSHYHNLPIQLTSLLGRDEAVRVIEKLFTEKHARLVTLTGPGGIGKTRLALQVGAELTDFFIDGVYFVELDRIDEPQLVLSAIAETLKLRHQSVKDVEEYLRSFLLNKQVLLILDNFEHVVQARTTVSQLLASCKKLSVLVTSRIPLHIRGEKEYPLQPLELPEIVGQIQTTSMDVFIQYPAIALFIERACDVKPDFKVTAQNLAVISEICSQLDGLPLAIELAASRIKFLPPHALLHRLSKRLQLLTHGQFDLPERQQTLRATIAWSYELLTPTEQMFFRHLAVFVGGLTLEAAEYLCSASDELAAFTEDALGLLSSLIDKSLLVSPRIQTKNNANNTINGEVPRFRMLETIREFALERLEEDGKLEAVQQAHTIYYKRLLERAYNHILAGEQEDTWLDLLESEHVNLLAVLNRAHTRQCLVLETQIVSLLWPFWLLRGYIKRGSTWLESLLTQKTAILQALDGLPYAQGEWQKILHGGGVFAFQRGEEQRALELLEESAALARQNGEPAEIIEVLKDLGHLLKLLGDLEHAQIIFEECLQIAYQYGKSLYIASALSNLGMLAETQEDLDRAASLYKEALGLVQQAGNREGMAVLLANLGTLAKKQGKGIEARKLLQDSLRIAWDSHYLLVVNGCLFILVEIAGMLGEYKRMARLLGAATAMRSSLGLAPLSEYETDEMLKVAKQELGETEWHTAFSAGELVTLEAVVQETLHW